MTFSAGTPAGWLQISNEHPSHTGEDPGVGGIYVSGLRAYLLLDV